MLTIRATVSVIAVLFCSVVPSYSMDGKSEVPKALLEYVRDATQLGLTDDQIRDRAIAAGWASTSVGEAIAATRATGAPEPAPGDRPKVPAAEPVPPPAHENKAALVERASAVAAAPTVPSRTAPAPAAAVAAASPDEYVIGAGDVLAVSVWKEPDASVPSVVVRPDGNISVPLIKHAVVAGLTATQAQAVIAERLAKFIPGADVTVVVSGINSKKIYVVGAVKKEGPIAYTYRMSVMQALSEAGGLNDYAKRKKIYVLRTSAGKNEKFPFDYNAVLKGEHMESNIGLLPNDTIVVPH